MRTIFCAICCLFMFLAKVTLAVEDVQTFKTISWADRKAWVESIKPNKYWQQRKNMSGIETFGGVPSIAVDGKPMPPLTSYIGYVHYTSYYKKTGRGYHDEMCECMSKSGIHYVPLYAAVYIKDSAKYMIDRNVVTEFIKKDPDVRFLLKVHFIVDTKAFSAAYPGNMILFEDGSSDHWIPSRKNNEGYSYASNIWERIAAEAIVKILNDLSRESFADRIFGVQVTFGCTGEGGWWAGFDWARHGIDYSPAMQDYFRNYLRKKYDGDVKKLQDAWKENVTFENAGIPPLQERGTDVPSSCNECLFDVPGSFGYFRNPQYGQTRKAIDFHMAMCDVMSERLSYLCQVVKKVSGGKLLTGSLHTPPCAATGFQWGGSGGSFSKIIKSPYLDTDSTPWAYEGRALGEGLAFRGPVDSMALHKKSLWVECDTRTSTTSNLFLGRERRYGAPLDVVGDKENLRRDFIRLITSRGANGYWYEITFPWFTLPEQRNIIAEISRLSWKLMNLDRRRNSQIAVIYDEDSIFYTTEFVNFVSLCRQMLQEFVYIGADFDMYTTDDIGTPELDNHKLFIFPNAICMDNAKRGRIEKYLKKDGRVLLWAYAPGLVNPDETTQLSVKNLSALVGMNIECTMRNMSPLMNILKSDDPLTASFSNGCQFGAQPRPVHTGPAAATPEKPFLPAPIRVFPQFFVNDGAAVKLGSYLDSGLAGYAVKRNRDWTSIYLGTYLIPSEILRAAAKEAGVHLYIESDDVVYHNRSLLGIHTGTPGKKTVKLPDKCDVYDIFEKRLIGRDINTFEIPDGVGKTYLYFTGNIDDLRKTGLLD